MNTFPITLTLYYPTMAQVEAYAGFVAMLSIAALLFILSLPVWYWSQSKTISIKNQPYLAPLVLGLNPVGLITLLAIHKYVIDINEMSGKIGFPLFAITPVIGLWIHAAI